MNNVYGEAPNTQLTPTFHFKKRASVLGSIIIIFLLLVVFKSLQLQVISRDRAIDVSKRQHVSQIYLLPQRGRILDSGNKELAMNVDARSMFVRPKNIKEPDRFADEISAILDIPREELIATADSTKSFVWIDRLLDDELVELIERLEIEGVEFVKESKRVYPNDHLAGQLIGFTDIDSKGIEGLEYHFDNSLAGKAGKIILKKDGRGRKFINNPIGVENGVRGKDIILTIDSRIQYIVEEELREGVEKSKAERAMAVMLNPETGAVLAMASYPFLDPNNKNDFPEILQRNLPIWYSFEPGSTMKTFLVSSLLEEKVVRPSTTFDCLNGKRRVGDTIINDINPYQVLTVSEVIKVSSNVCASLMAEKLGKERLYDYLKKFGFGEKTGIDLPGESTGKIIDQALWGPVELATHSFGQGFSVNSIQLASALSTIANGGFLIRPHLVQKITGQRASDYKQFKPKVVRKVLSYETTRAVTEILEGVVEGGSGRRAAIKGYKIAGKTGTAQVPNPSTGGYYDDRFIASFIGFAPSDDPRITLVVIVDNPKTSTYGGTIAAPIFKAITEKVLFYMNVPPDSSFLDTGVMPNLTGMSYRDVLKWAEKEGVRIRIKGSGYATSQTPKIGERIDEDTVCLVELSQNL